MFEVGKTYKRQDGKDVTIVAESNVGTPYHCVQGDDISETTGKGIWRYARPNDAGRVTASAFDMSDPRNLVPPTEEARKHVAAMTEKWRSAPF